MSQSKDGTGEAQEGKPQKFYKKDLSILIDVGDNKKVKAQTVIGAAVSVLGHGKVFACVPRSGNLYELTLSDSRDVDNLEDGLWIEGTKEWYPTRKTVKDTFVVSMMHLPTYITDSEIEKRMADVDVQILSTIKRRYVEFDGDKYADGTRFCKVRLQSERKSLPFTMKFSDGDYENYYRVIHDGQCKTCSICGDNTHMKKDCPEFLCYFCGGQGHIKRQCTKVKCRFCFEFTCRCDDDITDSPEEKDLCDKCGGMSHECCCLLPGDDKFDEDRKDADVIDDKNVEITENTNRNVDADEDDAEDDDIVNENNENDIDNTSENEKVDKQIELSEDEDMENVDAEDKSIEAVSETTETITTNITTEDERNEKPEIVDETVFGDVLSLNSNVPQTENPVQTPVVSEDESTSMQTENSDTRKRGSTATNSTRKKKQRKSNTKKKGGK